jgi:hypothetical protein
VAAFVCGSLITAHLTHVQEVKADSNRVFELMVYHAEPGKVHALESVFKDVSKLQTKHGLNVIGYWCRPMTPPPGRTRLSTLSFIPARATRKRTGTHFMPTQSFYLTEMRLCL